MMRAGAFRAFMTISAAQLLLSIFNAVLEGRHQFAEVQQRSATTWHNTL